MVDHTWIGGIAPRVPTLKQIDYTQAGIVQNTWYTVATLNNVEIDNIAVGCTVANETMEIEITVDGIVFTGAAAVNLGQYAAVDYIRNLAQFVMAASAANVDATSHYSSWPLKGRTILIRIRKTTAAGASAGTCLGNYHQY